MLLTTLAFAQGIANVMNNLNYQIVGIMVVMMCLEILLNAVVLSFVGFAVKGQTLPGIAMTFFIYVAASCEIALAMAIVVLLVKRRGSLDLGAHQELKG